MFTANDEQKFAPAANRHNNNTVTWRFR